MTKVCPLCGKNYDTDITKRCPLLHCPNCGKTALSHTHYWEIVLPSLMIFSPFLIPQFGDWAVRSWWVVLLVYSFFYAFLAVAFVAYYGPRECDGCGAKFLLPKKNISLAEEYFEKRCKNCGAVLPQEAKFCGKCGAKIHN